MDAGCEDSEGTSVVIIPMSKGEASGERSAPWFTLTGPQPSGLGRLTHRIVAEELTVAAVTELSISLMSGG